jgi:hypothetical protein
MSPALRPRSVTSLLCHGAAPPRIGQVAYEEVLISTLRLKTRPHGVDAVAYGGVAACLPFLQDPVAARVAASLERR